MQNPICAERNITGKGYPASLPVIPYSLLYTQLPILQSYTMHLLPWTSCRPNHCPQACFHCFPRDWHRLHVYCLMIIYTQTALCLLVSYNVIQHTKPQYTAHNVIQEGQPYQTLPYHAGQHHTIHNVIQKTKTTPLPRLTAYAINNLSAEALHQHHHLLHHWHYRHHSLNHWMHALWIVNGCSSHWLLASGDNRLCWTKTPQGVSTSSKNSHPLGFST